jgi:hypothetical protein
MKKLRKKIKNNQSISFLIHFVLFLKGNKGLKTHYLSSLELPLNGNKGFQPLGLMVTECNFTTRG